MVRLYKNFDISKNHKGSIILIGNFDGVHLGHQKLNLLNNLGVDFIVTKKFYQLVITLIQISKVQIF